MENEILVENDEEGFKNRSMIYVGKRSECKQKEIGDFELKSHENVIKI
jgi:hypothetical protein